MAAYQAHPSLGFSRQEHWSGLPFPSPMPESEKWKWSCSVVSNPLQPHRLQPTRLLHPQDFPGKSTGVGCHCLLQIQDRASFTFSLVLLKSNHSRKNVFDLIKKRFKIVSTTAFRHQFTEYLLHTWHFSKGKKRKNRKICHSVEFLTA